MDLIFVIFYLVFTIAFEIDYLMGILYYVQMSGYSYRSIFASFVQGISKSYLIWILYLIVFVSMLVINYTNIYFLFLMLLLSGSVIIFASDKYDKLKKINYTKRMWRIIVVSALILILYIVFTLLCYSQLILLVMMPIILPLNYLVVALALTVLSPIESIIKNHYLKKTKLKLRSMKNLIKIGITGSYGKTSTKEILATILAEHYYTLATPKSYNTPMGISKVVLEELNSKHEVFVCEMGAKKVGEIKELCDLVDVNYGIVTAVGRQHTSTFGSMKNIYRTKKELPDYLTGKTCIFNLTNKYVYNMYKKYVGEKIGVFYIKNHDLHNTRGIVKKRIKIHCRCRLYDNMCHLLTFPKNNNVYAKQIEYDENGCKFKIYYGVEYICEARTILIGVHNIINILLSVSMAKMLGVSNSNIEIGIKKIQPIRARLEKFVGESGAIILNNGYNSNIDSLDYSLRTVRLFNKPNILVVTPGVIESKDMYLSNKLFGEKIGLVATEVIIVKKLNKDAIYSGLISSGFDSSKIYFASNFNECKRVLDKLGRDYIVLIENDLPDNYI